MNYHRLNSYTLTCLTLLSIFFSGPILAEDQAEKAAGAYSDLTTYTITRKGKRIGKHELRITRSDNTIVVDVTSNIQVTLLKIPVFSFDYAAQEIWRDGQLDTVTSRVKENDKVSDVGLNSSGELSNINTLDGPQQVARLKYTSNHWNPAVVNATRVFNTLTGKASNVSVAVIGEETIGNGITATHYQYSGDINADSWYDANGKWVKLSFAGKDGSLIEYTIDQ